ncbi:Medium chain dehydrogenases/reductase (MDR)/zinc-dependent alcohol dehydrogenase-like protein [Halomicronema hongdechloris C2206]|uniref:Medium chain dehydrogenases/reductase (MDR)/zinc-dependent alcohol dehydrogenase-like protein n=1 Tax=Halomicronema hongdechloris C2206 TaxID=1641165 RepID=A0A1Z3HI13_9CYAN|nr:NAD(P)-dependent alcohol dehydrogenase [Halomicronema hongdechloris]ASC69913.1 Medium chain dehydrogenases/reductase (MDR)/zinc-dependent alcohol dehydrogenase-like protein [Halomicronema hongdechloris C2206]
MKAIAQTEYGSPEVLRLEEVDKPVPQDDQVLIRVRAASVDAGVWHLMRGTPFLIRLIYGGLRRPKQQILGSAIAGDVEAIGKHVTQFQPGDAVFGDLSESGFGGFAEYVCAAESALALKPRNLTVEEAATVPVSGLAALQGLRDVGQLQAGQQVLIVGASGGVGSFAVQIAKAFGAEVTGVCHSSKVDMVRSHGADQVIDYTQTDVAQAGQQYDLILDAAAFRAFADYLPVLKPGGTYVMVGGSTPDFFRAMLLGPVVGKWRDRSVKCLASQPQQADLLTLKDLLDTGKVVPFIDRIYPLSDVPDAIRYLEQRRVRGKVAISIC